MSEEGTTTCYQIVREDMMSPLEDSPIEHTVEHNGQGLVYEEQPTHTHSYTSSSSHSSSNSSGEVQRGWTYEDQFKEVSRIIYLVIVSLPCDCLVSNCLSTLTHNCIDVHGDPVAELNCG